MYAVTAAEFTAEGTANILINQYTYHLGMTAQHTLGQQPPGLLKAFAGGLQASGGLKIATSSYHPNGNGGVERVNHTMAQTSGNGG